MKNMKKILFLTVVFLLSLTLAACNFGNTPGGGGNGGEDYIFDPYTEIQLVVGDEVSEDIRTDYFNALYPLFIKAPKTVGADSERVAHEVVIGETDREVSKEAYRKLSRMEDLFPDGTVGYLIHSDGTSVAIAYTEDKYGISMTATQALEEILSRVDDNNKLTLKAGTVTSDSFDAYTRQKELDQVTVDEQWKALAEGLGEHGEAVVAAFKDMYGMYTVDMIYWYANLYDPAIGGYYYSNSGRDTEGYLPDIESTAQALNAITTSGMVSAIGNGYQDALPEWMKEQLIYFTKSLQHPGGYFYHPQWGKEFTDTKVSRRARDLGSATGILYKLGSAPTYDTPNGDEGDGILADGSLVTATSYLSGRLGGSTVSAVSKVVLVSSGAEVPYFLVDEAAFRAYLGTLNIKDEAYSIGNTMTAQKQQISNRDEQIGTPDNPTPLMDILINWFNENQNPERGSWANEEQQGTYNEINGIMKITGVYGGAGVLMPNADKAIWIILDAIGYEETPGAVVDVYNTWYAASRLLRHMRDYGDEADQVLADQVVDELRAKAPELIRDSAKKLAVFRKNDGSFSYTPNASSANSQGCPVAIRGTNEGDVNATVICSSDILVYIYSALYADDLRVPIFTLADWYEYRYTLENLNPVIKNPEVVIDEPYTFEDDDIGAFEHDTITSSLKSAESSANVVEYENKEDGKHLLFTTEAGKESILVSSGGLASSKSCYVFESDMCLYEANSNYPIQLYISGCYMLAFKIQNGKLNIVEATSSSNKLSRDTLLGITPEFGEWFKIRMEYYPGTQDTTRIKVFYNDELVAVTDGFYDESCDRYINGNATPGRICNNAQIYVLNGCKVKLGLDNLMFYKSDDKYTPITDPENSPAINIDLPLSIDSAELVGGEYYNGNAEGTRYGFAESLDKSALYNKTYDEAKGVSSTAVPMMSRVSDGVLVLKNASNWKGVCLGASQPITGETGDYYIFETDFVWLGGAQESSEISGGAAFVGFLGENRSTDNTQMYGYGYMSFVKNDPNKLNVYGASLTKGVSYNLRFVYQVGGFMTLYVDGELVSVTKVYGSDNMSDDQYQGFGFYFRKSFTEEMSIVMDNVYIGMEKGDGTVVQPEPPIRLPETAVNPNSVYNSDAEGTRYSFTDGKDKYSVYNADTNPDGFLSGELNEESLKSYNGGKVSFNTDDMLLATADSCFAGISFKNKGDTQGKSNSIYVFETDFAFVGGTPGSETTVAYVGFTSGNETNPDMFAYGYMQFADSEGSAVSFWGSRFERGVWYNLRFEYCVADKSVSLYVNGVLKGTMAVRNDGKETANSLLFNGFGVYIRNRMAEPLQLAFDNVYLGVK